MRLHEADAYETVRTEGGVVLADDIHLADGFLSRAVGLMFRPSVPDGYALVFEFGRERRVGLHTAFVRFPIDAVFLGSDNAAVAVRTLRPWFGYASERAASVVELPAGAAGDVDAGDRLVIE